MDLSLSARRDRAVKTRSELEDNIAMLRARLSDRMSSLVPGDPWADGLVNRTRSDIDRLTRRLEHLNRSIAHIDTNPNDADKAPARLVAALNEARDAGALRSLISDASGGNLRLTSAQANAIIGIRAGLRGQRFTRARLADLDAIRPGLLDDLLDALRGGTLFGRRNPQTATLLPVRLETRFDPPTLARPQWRLRLRVIPDRPWFSAHQPSPSDGELDDIEQFWRDLAGESPVSRRGQDLFARLASFHGAPRALWMMRTFPVTGADGDGLATISRPANRKPEIAVNRIVDFPSALEVWAEHGANTTKLADLQVDTNGLSIDLGDPGDPNQVRWWEDFKVAQNVGLGAEILLPFHPGTIDALYVFGLGPHGPDRVFEEHRDAGVLSVMPPGAPTNAVDGAPSGGDESEARWLELLGVPAAAQPGTRAIGAALTSDADAIGPIPGGELPPDAAARDVLSAIWPSAWGHAMADIFGGGEAVDRLGLWASQAVAPRGHIPTLRIGRAIYGVLPVSDLNRWTFDPGDPPIEREMLPGMQRALAAVAERAEASGTAVGADTDALMSIVEQPAISGGVAVRQMVEGQLLQMLAYRVGEGISQADLDVIYEEGVTGLRDANLYRDPARRLFAVGPPLDVTAPLVTPENTPDFPTFADLIKELLKFDDFLIASESGLREVFGNERPISLLFELVLRAFRLTAARARLAAKTPDVQALEPLFKDEMARGNIEQLAQQLMPADLALSNPQTLIYRVVRDAAQRLTAFKDHELETALLACLDCASYRIDPFVTGFPARRLSTITGMSPVRRLGAYGWVDRPFEGAPGPVDETLLLAPSPAQAATAALLRDRSLSDADPARWHMDVSSGNVRRAALLAEEVRAGVHLAEAMGRMVEETIAAPASIDALRQAFPQRVDEAGRSTCDGLAVLRAPAAGLPLTAAERARLGPWREALDVYGDLLVSEAVHHAANGRPARAQAAMEAAAGLSAPPEFDLLATPRETSEAVTTVLFAIPHVALPGATDAFTHPVTVAEPSLSAFLSNRFGAPDSAAWTWDVTPDAGRPAVNVTLDDLDLTVPDMMTLGADAVTKRVVAFAGGGAVTGGEGPRNHERLGGFASSVARDPAAQSDFAGTPDSSPDQRAELAQRFVLLRTVGEDLVAELQTQSGAGGTAAGRAAALRAAESWGIRPLPEAAANLDASQRCENAARVLAARLAAAPSAADIAGFDLGRIAERLAALATEDGHLPIMSVIETPAAGTPLPVVPAPQRPAGIADLEEDWLPVVASVREPMARFETLQLDALLDGAQPFSVWTDRPNDPWQTAAPRDADGRRRGSSLLVIFGPAGVLDGVAPETPLAIGRIDGWAERVPESDQSAGMAFNFNAPSARAQNAILAVAPPRMQDPIDSRALLGSLQTARSLARARMLGPDGTGDFAAAVSTALLPAVSGMTDRLTGDRSAP